MKILLIVLCLFSQVAEKQKELDQLKAKLDNVRTELKNLEKEKVGTLARIEKIDEAVDLTLKYTDELSAQENREKDRIQELDVEIARLEAKMKMRKDDLRARLIRLYKWTPFYKMEVIFSSRSLPEILATSYYLQILAQEDQRTFFESKSDWERYLTDKRMREELITTLAERRKEKEKELANLGNERKKKQDILDRVKREEQVKKEVEKDLKSAQRRLEEMIVALEKQREKERQRQTEEYLESQRGKLPWPCQGRVETKFGNVVHPRYNTKTKNNGIDISGNYGDNVFSVAPGKVVYADRFMGYGNLVLIDHLDGYYSLYGHLAEIVVSVGDEVSAGRIIGRVGESGSLSGPMLHFELRKNGKPVDPLAYLK